MPSLQFVDISNSQVKFVNEEKNQEKKLQEENAALKLALAELAEAQEQSKIETQLALAELAETMIAGGVE